MEDNKPLHLDLESPRFDLNNSGANSALLAAASPRSAVRNKAAATRELLTNESKKYLHQGLFKKVFTIVDKLYKKDVKLTLAETLSMLRRVMRAIIKILTKQLSAVDLNRPERVQKILKRADHYLERWHTLLLQLVGGAALPGARRQTIAVPRGGDFSAMFKPQPTPPTRGHHFDHSVTLAPSQFAAASKEFSTNATINMSRRSKIGDRTDDDMLEAKSDDGMDQVDMYEEDYPLLMAAEDLKTESHISLEFNFDEYFLAFLEISMSWGTYFRRIKKPKYAVKFYIAFYKISKQFETSFNPDILNVCIRGRFQLALLYMECGLPKESIEVFSGLIPLLHSELSIRLARNLTLTKTHPQLAKSKFKTCLRLFLLTCYNLALNMEMIDNYSGALESLRLGLWLAENYLDGVDEVAKTLFRTYTDMHNNYTSYLKELGELEAIAVKVLGINIMKAEKVDDVHENNTDENKFYVEVNNHIYHKYGYQDFYRDTALVIKSQREDTEHDIGSTFARKELRMHTDFGLVPVDDDGSPRVRDFSSNGDGFFSVKNANSEGRILSPSDDFLSKMKKAKKKKKIMAPEVIKPKVLSTNKYFLPRSATRIMNESGAISDSSRHKLLATMSTVSKKATHMNSLVDVNQFFGDTIVNEIERNNTLLGYHAVCDKYAEIQNDEKFDRFEFEYGHEMLMMRKAETLTENTGKLPFSVNHKQLLVGNDLNADIYFLTAREEAIHRLEARKEAKAEAKKAKKMLSLIHDIQDTGTHNPLLGTKSPKSNRGASANKKVSFGDVMLKHNNEFKLELTSQLREKVSDEKEKRERKRLSFLYTPKNNSDLISPVRKIHTDDNEIPERAEEKMAKLNLMTKKRIEMMMEQVDRDMKHADKTLYDHKHPKQQIKPTTAPQQKLLSNYVELANSTYLLHMQRSLAHKTTTFGDVVKVKAATHNKSVGHTKLATGIKKLKMAHNEV